REVRSCEGAAPVGRSPLEPASNGGPHAWRRYRGGAMTNTSTLGLDGRVALVTGGTRGLGRAITERLVSCGCHVYATYRSEPAGARAVEEAVRGDKGTLATVCCDATDAGAMAALLRRVGAEHGRLDVLVHNAASFHPMPAVGADAQTALADVSIAITPL